MKFFKNSFIIFLFCTMGLVSCDMGTDSKPSGTITTPVPTSPVDNAVSIPVTATFEWTGSADKLQISMGINFENLKYDVAVTGQTHTVPTGNLLANTIYYWRVGQSYSGGVSWCDGYKFTTAAP
jgi:hypothetical protein